MTGGPGRPVLTDERPPAALISSARNATPLRPLVAQGRASSLDTATDCPTFTFGTSPAVVTVITGSVNLIWPHCSSLIWPHPGDAWRRSSPLIWPRLAADQKSPQV